MPSGCVCRVGGAGMNTEFHILQDGCYAILQNVVLMVHKAHRVL